MTQTCSQRWTRHLTSLTNRLPEPAGELNLVLSYVDEPTRLWAAEAKATIEQSAAGRRVRSTWWRLEDLYQPGVLAAAVSQTLRAGVIVVATPGAEGLPLPFYFWVNAWLPHYPRGSGLLVGLLGRAEDTPQAGRVRQYLEAVARRGRIALALEERGV
jgi:hypothetical protein